MDNKEMPSNSRMEQELLSQIIKKNDLMVEAMELLDTKDFYYTKHQRIYETMKILHKRNEPIEVTSICEVIGQEGLKKFGGITYLVELTDCAASLNNFNYNLKKLQEYGLRRKSIKVSEKFIGACLDETKDINLNISKLNNMLVPVEAKNSIEDMSTMLEKTLNMVEDRYKRGGGIPGMTCGLSDLDNAINGFEKQNLDIIAARPSIGRFCRVCQ